MRLDDKGRGWRAGSRSEESKDNSRSGVSGAEERSARRDERRNREPADRIEWGVTRRERGVWCKVHIV